MALYIDDFMTLYNLAKLQKKGYYKITDNCILGTDYEFSTLSVIYRNDNIKLDHALYFDKNDINMILKNGNFGYINNNVIYDAFGYEQFWVGRNTTTSLRIDALENNLFGILNRNYPIVYQNDMITDNDLFKNATTAKASEGARSINIGEHVLTMYGGMYPINKNDKASMKIYQLPDNTVLSEVTIYKPKVTIISYIRYRNTI